ncbi:hypothetical protein LIER_32707 [Lithospermum erythrorhizon]|uniref:Pectinesterase inhibitor domain-containing protein n=1 Tax=Lithospermum erythrorhizon TaxID=34254 RepID=A0AAV3RYA2_LITER
MDVFTNAKAVRLKNVHNKYLTADEDEESVTQDRNGSSKNAKWTVEFVEHAENIIHLKSCYNNYLTASDHPFLLGMTGRKVTQTLPMKLDSSVQWEPIKDGGQVKLRTRYGQFLRANGGLPPWRNSVTHDIPHRTTTQDWILWDVDVVDIVVRSSGSLKPPQSLVVDHYDSFASDSSPVSPYSSRSPSFSRQESNDSTGAFGSPPRGGEGRVIYFHIANECGEYDEGEEELGIQFKGNDVSELTKKLEEVCGIENVVVCTKSPLNGKLNPLRLQLPPNNSTMHVVVVPSSSNVFVIPSTIAINEKSLEKICSKTNAKQNCLNLLTSDYRTSYVSLKDLTEVAIDVTLKKLNEAREKFDVLGDGISDNNYDEYSSCSRKYKDAINKLESTKESWKSLNYNNIGENVKDALHNIEHCKKGSLDYSSDVERIIDDAKLACNIIKVTFHQFIHSKKHKNKKQKHEDEDDSNDD